jgi:hypothetical protein
MCALLLGRNCFVFVACRLLPVVGVASPAARQRQSCFLLGAGADQVVLVEAIGSSSKKALGVVVCGWF